MTKPDYDSLPNPALRKGLIAIIGGIMLVFLTGVTLGYTVTALKHEAVVAKDIAIIATMLLASAGVTYACFKLWPRGEVELLSESSRKSRKMFCLSASIGIAIGIFISLSGGADPAILFSNGPVAATPALVASLLYLVLTPIVTIMWLRNTDEHELGAYRDGASLAAHVYAVLVPAWWFASRGGWLPPLDPMIAFSLFVAIWCIGWGVKRYV